MTFPSDLDIVRDAGLEPPDHVVAEKVLREGLQESRCADFVALELQGIDVLADRPPEVTVHSRRHCAVLS